MNEWSLSSPYFYSTTNTTNSISSLQTYYVDPSPAVRIVSAPKPEDELAWLRRRVNEVVDVFDKAAA